MMDRTDLLRELAHRNFAEFANDPALVAAIVTGSVARGGCDEASDIDTILYFDGPLTAERLEAEKAKGEASGGGFYGGTPEEGFGAWRRIDGVKCDFGFEPASEVDRLIDDLYERTDLDLDKQLIVLGIRDAIVLAGEERVAGWRERTDVYPRVLGRAMIEKHLKPAPAWVYRVMAAERGERVWLSELMVEAASNLLGVLCGLNEVWHPGKLKGSRRAFDRLRVAPAEVGPRVDALFGASLVDAAEEAARLWEETLTLVERHAPDVDTAAARRRFEIALSGATSG